MLWLNVIEVNMRLLYMPQCNPFEELIEWTELLY